MGKITLATSSGMAHNLVDRGLKRDQIQRAADPLCELSDGENARSGQGGGQATLEAVRSRGVVADLRQPDVIRLAPVPLYSTFSDVRRAAFALLEACA